MAISSPMIPPPSTSSRSGMSSRSRRAGGVDHPRVVVRDERQPHRLRAGRDDRRVERHRASSTRPARRRTACSVEVNVPVPTRVWTLRCLASPVSPPVSRVTTPSFQPRSASRSIVGAAKERPCAAHLLGLGDDLRRVQQRLGRDAADVEADPAQRAAGVDHHDLLAQVRRPERGGVAARPGTQHQHLGVHVALRPVHGAGAPAGARAVAWCVGGPADDPYPAGAGAPRGEPRRRRDARRGAHRPGRYDPSPGRSRTREWTSTGSRAGRSRGDGADGEQRRQPLDDEGHRPDGGGRRVEVGVAAVVEDPGGRLPHEAGEHAADHADQRRDDGVPAHDRQERGGAQPRDDRDVVGDREAHPEAQEEQRDRRDAEEEQLAGSLGVREVRLQPQRGSRGEQPGRTGRGRRAAGCARGSGPRPRRPAARSGPSPTPPGACR